MGKMATGFRDLSELEKWDFEGQRLFEYAGMKYVWILAEVEMLIPHKLEAGKRGGGGERIYEHVMCVLPARFFILNRRACLVDVFGAERLNKIVAWKPIESIMAGIDTKIKK